MNSGINSLDYILNVEGFLALREMHEAFSAIYLFTGEKTGVL